MQTSYRTRKIIKQKINDVKGMEAPLTHVIFDPNISNKVEKVIIKRLVRKMNLESKTNSLTITEQMLNLAKS